jgi:hypothetical protein
MIRYPSSLHLNHAPGNIIQYPETVNQYTNIRHFYIMSSFKRCTLPRRNYGSFPTIHSRIERFAHQCGAGHLNLMCRGAIQHYTKNRRLGPHQSLRHLRGLIRYGARTPQPRIRKSSKLEVFVLDSSLQLRGSVCTQHPL